VSAFAAALAATTGKDLKQPDTGPVPLPPPPGGDDLIFSEPSGILNLSHMSAANALPRPTTSPVIDTFGGVAVTTEPRNGTAPSPPVVVVAGPAQGAAPWVKWSVLALLIVTLGLGGTVVYLVTRPPPPRPPTAETTPTTTGGKVEDTPIQLSDPAPPTTIGPAVDPKKAPPKSQPKPQPKQAGEKKGTALSADQQKLAALYNEAGDNGTPKETAPVDHSARAQAQVSQTSILAVVTQNRRALNLCYDRVLKHDQSLKRARLMTHVKVGISGVVTNVTVVDSEYANSEIGQCITQTIKRWHFPAADSEYETEFPILLQAD
jgi:hypothetical protein